MSKRLTLNPEGKAILIICIKSEREMAQNKYITTDFCIYLE